MITSSSAPTSICVLGDKKRRNIVLIDFHCKVMKVYKSTLDTSVQLWQVALIRGTDISMNEGGMSCMWRGGGNGRDMAHVSRFLVNGVGGWVSGGNCVLGIPRAKCANSDQRC